MAKVSVITPTYNHEKYIADCIRSVQNQTFTDWEMIIVDDGSTDNTYSIAKTFAEKDNRIHVYTQKNIGIFRLAETYNFALKKSQGEFIAVLEGDDWWFENKLELQVAGLIKNEKLVLSWGKAYSSSSDLSESNSLYPLTTEDASYFFNTPEKPILSILLFRNIIPALTIVVRKSYLEKIGGFIQKHRLPLVDIPTLQELALLGEFDFVDNPLGKWRNYPNQITKTYTVEIFNGYFLLAKDMLLEHKNLLIALGFTEKKIKNHFYHIFVISYSRSGRYKLIKKDFKGAQKDYVHSIFNYGLREPIWKLRSLTGLIFGLFHLNIEGLASALGRTSYK